MSLLLANLFHWKNPGFQGLWLIHHSEVNRTILPLHDICLALGDELVKCLPALPALTGCDTTSKISTKLPALKVIRNQENASMITNFNHPELTEGTLQAFL